jgi:peptide/nickel transport system substrate-binding protein
MALVTILAAVLVPMASAQEDSEVTLRIGLTQDWSTLNPIRGYAVPDYEVWNLQYATLTNKAAADFETIPGLAESWEASDDGLTYTYTLREGLTWSDGEPLTAEDIAWNITTAVEQPWANMISTVRNLTAEVIDERTVRITSSVPDPKLPTMDVYLVPKHIWEPVATDRQTARQYEALDGVGSGPFVLESFIKGQSVTMVANPSSYAWEGQDPPIDRIVFQLFDNPDAMVAALQQNELDAIHGFPPSSASALEGDPNIVVVAGQQGGFDEIAINGGAVEGQPHPALLDLRVREAISHAIDKQAVIEDLWFGLADPLEVMSPSADPKWLPEIPVEDQFNYDPALANQILDEAGYLDTDNDGIREMPDGSNPIILRHAVNTDGDQAGEIGELFVGWMEQIGIGVQLESYDQDALFDVIIDGTYDTFFWGWIPFVDPDPMLSYFTEEEIGNYSDANWFDPAYDAMYAEQNTELDPDRRLEIVHDMLTLFHDAAIYIPMYLGPDLQAYRTDTFEGWVQQPADVGPVMFSNSSPSYVLLHPVGDQPDDPTATTIEGTTGSTTDDGTPVAGGDGDDSGGGANWLLIAGLGVVVVGGGVLIARRRGTADERE